MIIITGGDRGVIIPWPRSHAMLACLLVGRLVVVTVVVFSRVQMISQARIYPGNCSYCQPDTDVAITLTISRS